MENTIRVERAKKRISQGDLAEKIGISRQSVHAIETGKICPSTAIALKIARYFKVEVEDIFTLDDND